VDLYFIILSSTPTAVKKK